MTSFYIQNEYQMLETLSTFIGVSRNAFSTGGKAVMPRVALIYNPIPTGTAKVLYSEGFRAPNIYEREYEEAGLQKRNPGLKPERIRTFEFVWEQRLTRKLYSTISLYQYTMKDLIDYSQDPQDSLLLYLNVARVKAHGIEWELKARLQDGLSGYAHAAIQKAEDGTTGVPLTNSPEILFGAGLTLPVWHQTSVAMEFFGETERTTVYGTRTPPFLSANFNLSGFEPLPHTRLSFKIRNLFNSRYRLPGGLEHRMDSIVQDGRSFDVRFTVEY
jgi:iron complex outermembrane receptor protein